MYKLDFRIDSSSELFFMGKLLFPEKKCFPLRIKIEDIRKKIKSLCDELESKIDAINSSSENLFLDKNIFFKRIVKEKHLAIEVQAVSEQVNLLLKLRKTYESKISEFKELIEEEPDLGKEEKQELRRGLDQRFKKEIERVKKIIKSKDLAFYYQLFKVVEAEEIRNAIVEQFKGVYIGSHRR